MQISELARRSTVPVATVKFYLREGLLPTGRATGVTRAEYDGQHLARLRLVRSLVEVAGLSLAAVRQVLAAADQPAESLQDAIGAAQEALPPAVPNDTDVDAALELVRELGWLVDPACVAVRQLAVAMATLETVGEDAVMPTLSDYGRAVHDLAEQEVAAVPTSSQEAAVRYVVVGTVFYEPVLLALRRLAQQDASTRRFPSGPHTLVADGPAQTQIRG